jgi:hypothetical protein
MARLVTVAAAGSSVSWATRSILVFLGTLLALAPLVISENPLTAVVFAADETKPPAPAAVASRPASEKILQALGTSTTVSFVDRPLSDAIDSVARDHSISVRFDQEALKATEVSLDKTIVLLIGGVSLRSVLYMLLEPHSLGYIVDGDEVLVTTRKLADAHVEQIAYAMHDAVQAGVSLADLGDAIVHSVDPSSWREQGGAGRLRVEQTKLIVRQRADVQRRVQSLLGDLERALVAVPGVFDGEPLETRAYPIGDLRKGVSEADLGNWLREMLLVTTSPDDLGRVDLTIEGDQMRLKQSPWVHATAVKYLAALRERGRKNAGQPPIRDDFVYARNGILREANRQRIRRQLATPVSADFLDLPCEDSLVFLKEYSRVNLWINHAEIRKLRINLDAPLTLNATNEPLSNLLDAVLIPLNLDWFVFEPGLMIVHAQPEDGPRMEPRVYGIQELREGGHTLEGLMALVMALDPGSWQATGGRGSMRPLAPGLLVVVQTRSVHDQIDKLIEKLLPARK